MKPIPEEVLVYLAAGDFYGAGQALLRHANSYNTYLEIRQRRAVARIEHVFREAHNCGPWHGVTLPRIAEYRRAIARFSELLGVEHLINDIRERTEAKSLKYFIVPAPGKVCRWEAHAAAALETRYRAESARFAQELEESAALLFASRPVSQELEDSATLLFGAKPAPAESAVPEWVEKSCRELQKHLRDGDESECQRIARKLAGFGWSVRINDDQTVSPIPKAVTVEAS